MQSMPKLAGLDSTLPGVKSNADGSVTVWFGPKASAGQECNWVQTWPDKGWNTIFRLLLASLLHPEGRAVRQHLEAAGRRVDEVRR